MPYYAVTFTHTSYLEAESEAAAKAQLVEAVQDNADVSECEADEISAGEYEAAWAEIEGYADAEGDDGKEHP